MRRILSMIASLSLMMSLSLTAISGQEPGPSSAPEKGQAKAQPAPAKAGESAKPKKDAAKAATDEEPVVLRLQSPGPILAFEVLDNVGAQARQHPSQCARAEQLSPPRLEPLVEYQPVRRFTICCVSKRVLIAPFSQFR